MMLPYLKYMKIPKLWSRFGKGQGKTILVIDTWYSDSTHGTRVVELIRRVAPKATIKTLDWIRPDGLTQVSEVLRQALQMKRDIVNMSFAVGHTKEVQELIQQLYDTGATLVTGSGNYPQNQVAPAIYPAWVIVVGSLYWRTGKVSPFTVSPYEVLAPGEDLGIEGYGTSYSAPNVAAVATCMLSKINHCGIEKAIKKWLKQ